MACQTVGLPKLNSTYDDKDVKKTLADAFQRNISLQNETSQATVDSSPFTHCVLPNFLKSNKFLEALKEELFDQIFYQKNNDLYKFQQTDDLKKISSPNVKAFREFLQVEMLPWLREISGIPLSDKIDATCSRYEYTDTLLCHDDELEGRRIAYILYLVPAWQPEDGGGLDLFDRDENGQPRSIVKTIDPVFNKFVFFDVTPASFHQVAEVLTENKTRLSVNGWFHGPPIHRPEPYREHRAKLYPYLSLQDDMLFDWINPVYLEPDIQGQIQEKFESDSEIELQGFLKDDKYQAVLAALRSSQLNWVKRGPANKRNYHRAVTDDIPEVLQECLKLFQSESFFVMLSNLTGLTFHELVVGNNSDSESEQEDDNNGLSDESENCSKVTQHQGAASGNSKDTCNDSDGQTSEASEPKKRKMNSDTSDLPVGASTDCGHETQDEEVISSSVKNKDINPRCRGEIRRWQHGSYTLIHDTDSEGFEFALDCMLFCSCKGWQQEFGGFSSYIAKEEDEELLTVLPADNSLALVYRDKETLRFVKHINKKVDKISQANSEFYDISFVYFE